MRNVIILGSGRSGTSMAAGVLAMVGYFMGENLNPATETNPKGQFEDREVNRINEDLLAQVTPRRPCNILGGLFFKSRPVFGQRWLARVPLGALISSPSPIEDRIKVLTEREPFCFKDPRFSYTLPVWRPFLRDAVFVCVFRDPPSSVRSILKQTQKVSHLRSFRITFKQAVEVWTLMYRHILEIHRHKGKWLFLHYDQLLNRVGLDRLEAFVGASVDRSFPDASLRHSFSEDSVPEKTQAIYQQLCELAEHGDFDKSS